MVLVVLVVLLVFIRISGRHRVVHDHEEEEYFDEIQDVKVTKDTRGQIRSATTCRGVIRRRGHATASGGDNVLKMIEKGWSLWGHDRRRLGPHPTTKSLICYKQLAALGQAAWFGADLHRAN